MSDIPEISLNDGYSIPQLGFGVWQVSNQEVVPAVRAAIETGYRSIDTAQGYDNEEGVGQAIREAGVPREELFITSKLRTKAQAYDDAIREFKLSLQKLKLDYLDLFLIHWPIPSRDLYPQAWKAFVKLQQDGKIRSIGVSNFLPEHIDRIVAETGVVPAVNQIEIHPEYQQRDVRAYHREKGIALESYSPLGSGAVLDRDAIKTIADKHGKSVAQVILRWHLQEGLIVIPKSTHAERIRENFDVFGFELDGGDMAAIAKLDREDGKTGSKPEEMDAMY